MGYLIHLFFKVFHLFWIMLDQYKVQFCIACFIKFSLILCFAVPTYSQTSDFFVRTYQPNETIEASQHNFYVTQSLEGNMLFANFKGLLTFNGKSWKLSPIKNRKNENKFFLSLYPTSDGRIYAGSENNIGYMQMKNGKLEFTSLLKQKEESFNSIIQIIQFKKLVFFLSFQKIFVTDGQKLLKTITTTNDHQFAYLHLAKGSLYLSKFGSIDVWDPSQLNFVPYTQHPFGKINNGRGALTILLGHHRQKVLSLFYKQGVWTRSGTEPFRKVQFPESVEAIFKEGVRRAYLYDQNTIIFSTFNQIYLLDLTSKTLKKVFQGTSFIRYFYIDQSKNIWMLDNDKITQVELSSPLKNYAKNLDIKEMITHQDGVFLAGVGKKHNLFWLKPNQELIPLNFAQASINLCHAGDGKLLAGTTTELFLVDYLRNKSQKVFTSNGIYLIKNDAQNNIYVSFRGKIKILRWTGTQIKEIGEIEHQKDKLALDILRRGNQLWIGFSQKGVACYEFDKKNFPEVTNKTLYSTAKGNFTGDDTNFSIHLYQSKIFANNPSGLYEFNDRLNQFNKLDILTSNSSKHIKATFAALSNGKIFISDQDSQTTSFGVAYKKGQKYTWNPTPFLRLPSLEVSGLMTYQEQLYIATSKGLFVYHPQKKKDYGFRYPAQIKAQVDSSSLAPDTTLAYGFRQLTFNYSIPFFEAPERLQ